MQIQTLQPVAKASREQTRQHNRRLVLQAIGATAAVSRADVARQTGLTPPTVSSIVADLVADGLVAEFGRAETAAIGKPPQLLGIASGTYQMACLDISGGRFSGAVIDLDGREVHRVSGPRSTLAGDAAAEAAATVVGELLEAIDAPQVRIAVATPGVVGPTGVVHRASFFEWADRPFAADLEQRFGVPAFVINDGHALALAELAAFDHRIDNLVVVRVARGVSAGIVLHGALFTGDNDAAGEIGFLLPSQPGQDPANHISRVSLGNLVGRFTGDEELIEAWDLAAAVDAAAGATLDSIGRSVGADLGRALAAVVGVLDIRTIRLDPSIAPLGSSLLAGVDETLRTSVVDTTAQHLDIRFGDAGADAVLRGAAIAVTHQDLGLVQRPGHHTKGEEQP